jgi:hypothetical protein
VALILWKTEYSVGDDTLDADHIVIISLIVTVRRGPRAADLQAAAVSTA